MRKHAKRWTENTITKHCNQKLSVVSLRLAVGSGTKTQHPQVEPQARDIRENASTCDFRSMQTDAVLTSKGKHPQKQSKRARDNFSHSIGSGPCVNWQWPVQNTCAAHPCSLPPLLQRGPSHHHLHHLCPCHVCTCHVCPCRLCPCRLCLFSWAKTRPQTNGMWFWPSLIHLLHDSLQ